MPTLIRVGMSARFVTKPGVIALTLLPKFTKALTDLD